MKNIRVITIENSNRTVHPVQNPSFVRTLLNDVSANLKNLNLDRGIPRPFCSVGGGGDVSQ